MIILTFISLLSHYLTRATTKLGANKIIKTHLHHIIRYLMNIDFFWDIGFHNTIDQIKKHCLNVYVYCGHSKGPKHDLSWTFSNSIFLILMHWIVNMGIFVFRLNLNVKYRITSEIKNSEFFVLQTKMSVIVYIMRCIGIRLN